MMGYDLCLAWNWEYDADFVALLDKACRSQGLSLLQIRPDNLGDLLHSVVNHQIDFRAFFDRASDVDARFMPLVQWACKHGVYCINSYEEASRTWDKARLHPVLIKAGLLTPHTIVLPSYEEQADVPPIDLKPLGQRFAIKPAHGGGGDGVVTGWNPDTHIYTPVTSAEKSGYCLSPLQAITASIAHLCRLDLFSTEIALTPDGHFVVVDYVNDQIDLRLQSRSVDGVPDLIVQDVAARLTGLVTAHPRPFPGSKPVFDT
ncbi:MAG: hypothetical protein P8186_04055 [Anaerolineae bacterium]